MPLERFIEAEVAHHRRHERVLGEAPALDKVERGDRHDLVAVDDLAVFIAKQHAVGITIVADADVRAGFLHDALDLFRIRAAAIAVDVAAVGRVVGRRSTSAPSSRRMHGVDL